MKSRTLSSLALAVGVYLIFGPLLMAPAWILVDVALGNTLWEYSNSLTTIAAMPFMWWIGAFLGIGMGSWLFTILPTTAAAVLFWLVSRTLERRHLLQFPTRVSRALVAAALGASTSALAFFVIALPFLNVGTEHYSPYPFPIREDLFCLLVVAVIGAALALILEAMGAATRGGEDL